MSAWIAVTPAHLAARARPRAAEVRLQIAAKLFDQGAQVRLVGLRRGQVMRDTGCDLLERLAETPVHVVPPHLAELTPMTADGREVFRQVMVELLEVSPELSQRLNIIYYPSHARSPSIVLRIQPRFHRG